MSSVPPTIRETLPFHPKSSHTWRIVKQLLYSYYNTHILMYICVISTPHFRLVHSLAFCYMCAHSLRATFQALAPLERNLSRGLSHWSRAQIRFQRGGIRLVASGCKNHEKSKWVSEYLYHNNIYIHVCIWVLAYNIYIYIHTYIVYTFGWRY